jgi:DNA-3-methyladenine glycosylase I
MHPSHEWHPTKPASLAGYLEALSRPIFSTGMSWRVVESKWDGIREAFREFEPEKVAAMTPADIDGLMDDRRVIRNRRKIEATVQNAETMLDLDHEHGGFDRYLRSHGSFEDTVADLRRNFRFLGESGAYYFLWGVAEPVPSYEEWSESHGRRSAA